MVLAIRPEGIDPQAVERRIHQLHTYYLEKHKEKVLPFFFLNDSIALIGAVALAIFSGLSGISAVFVGIGGFGLIVGVGRLMINLSSALQVNRRAGEAIISPGFYEYASQNLPQLSTAEKIVKAHELFILN